MMMPMEINQASIVKEKWTEEEGNDAIYKGHENMTIMESRWLVPARIKTLTMLVEITMYR